MSAKGPRPGGPYSHAVSHGGLVFLSGQRPTSPEDGTIPEGLTAQARQVLRNLATVLESAGTSLDRVVKVNAYLADIADFAEWNSVYQEFFREPFPARTTVACQLRGILVEVDVVAALPTEPQDARTTGA